MLRGDRLLRLSFSRSLCDHIAGLTPGARVAPVRVRVGRVLSPGQPSRSGLYAVCKASGWPLRVTLFPDLAERWRHPTRVVREAWLDGPPGRAE